MWRLFNVSEADGGHDTNNDDDMGWVGGWVGGISTVINVHNLQRKQCLLKCMPSHRVQAHCGSSQKVPGMFVSEGVPIVLEISSSCSRSLPPGNSAFRSSSSPMMQPTLHMSTSGP